MPTTAELLIMAAVLLATLAYEVWLERQSKQWRLSDGRHDRYREAGTVGQGSGGV